MPITHTKIATTTLSSSISTIDFAGITSAFTDLVIVGQVGATGSGTGLRFRLNNNTNSIYRETRIYASHTGSLPGTPLAASASYGPNNFFYLPINTNITTGLNYTFFININSYANTGANKSVLWRYNFMESESSMGAGSFATTSAISEVNFFVTSNEFAAGSKITIYGIKAA